MTCLILPNTSYIKRYFAYTVSDQDCVLSQTSQSCLFRPPTQPLDLIQEQPAAAHISLMVINLWPCAPEPPWGWESWGSCAVCTPNPSDDCPPVTTRRVNSLKGTIFYKWGPKTGWADTMLTLPLSLRPVWGFNLTPQKALTLKYVLHVNCVSDSTVQGT